MRGSTPRPTLHPRRMLNPQTYVTKWFRRCRSMSRGQSMSSHRFAHPCQYPAIRRRILPRRPGQVAASAYSSWNWPATGSMMSTQRVDPDVGSMEPFSTRKRSFTHTVSAGLPETKRKQEDDAAAADNDPMPLLAWKLKTSAPRPPIGSRVTATQDSYVAEACC